MDGCRSAGVSVRRVGAVMAGVGSHGVGLRDSVGS